METKSTGDSAIPITMVSSVFSLPNQMHYRISSLITISDGNSLLLIQLKDWKIAYYKRLGGG